MSQRERERETESALNNTASKETLKLVGRLQPPRPVRSVQELTLSYEKKTPAIKGRSQAFTHECTGNRTLFQTAINSQILLLDDNHRVPVRLVANPCFQSVNTEKKQNYDLFTSISCFFYLLLLPPPFSPICIRSDLLLSKQCNQEKGREHKEDVYCDHTL